MVVLSSALQFTKTQRGRIMLVFEGFKYVVNRESQKNTFWRCNRYVKYGCRAGAVTSKVESGEPTIRLTHQHSHQKEKIMPHEMDEFVKGYEVDTNA